MNLISLTAQSTKEAKCRQDRTKSHEPNEQHSLEYIMDNKDILSSSICLPMRKEKRSAGTCLTEIEIELHILKVCKSPAS
jgi:hypothetical protein